MAFKLGDIIVKEIIYAMASNITTGDPLYVLTQLSEANINITSESSDVTDKDGNLVKRIWKSKAGEFTATNAFLNMNILAASGAITDIAAIGNKLSGPKIIKVPKGTLTKTLENVVTGSITVNQYFGDGSLGKKYELGTSASATEFAVATDGTTTTLTLPTDAEAEYYMVKFNREFESGAIIKNSAKEFPNSVNMLMKVLYFDPCAKDVVKAAYVEMPSFQVSPETSMSLSSDSPTQDFNGSLEIDYCSDDKDLYNIYLVDEEDAD